VKESSRICFGSKLFEIDPFAFYHQRSQQNLRMDGCYVIAEKAYKRKLYRSEEKNANDNWCDADRETPPE
jgi:hypothetical protein